MIVEQMLAVCVFAHSLVALFLDDFLGYCVGLFLGIMFFINIVPKHLSVKAINVKILFNHVFPSVRYGADEFNPDQQ